MKTVPGFIAEVGDISRFTDAKQIQKLAGQAIVENSSGKHNGRSKISKRGRKRLRYVLFEGVLSLAATNYGYIRTRLCKRKSIHSIRRRNKKRRSIVTI